MDYDAIYTYLTHMPPILKTLNWWTGGDKSVVLDGRGHVIVASISSVSALSFAFYPLLVFSFFLSTKARLFKASLA